MATAAQQGKVTRVAVMQPYFFPYAGYYRLLAAADIFVILDCVQFNRRGRVHRAEVPAPGGDKEWLTLPLSRQPREVLIRDLAFAADARTELDRRLRRHPWLLAGKGPAAERVRDHLFGPLPGVVAFLEAGLRLVAGLCALPTTILRSSTLSLPEPLRGQERIIAIARALGAGDYLNAPGGRHLYQPAAFAAAGVGLSFLPPYTGAVSFMLPALVSADPADIRADILDAAKDAMLSADRGTY